MDTPSTGESNASLSVREAAALFSAPADEPKEQQPAQAEPAAVEPSQEAPDATQAETDPESVEQEPQTADETITIEVDGKAVEVKKSELPEIYKNGLRQADYTRKTMETAEQRKAAEAEATKAREERQQYAQGLQQTQAMLVASLQEQQKIDWDTLLQQDPQEFLKQKHLLERRQAALQETMGRQKQLGAYERAEAKKSLIASLEKEHQAVLDKLPEWKDAKKADAERGAIIKELMDRGFEQERIFGKPDPDGSPSLENPGLTDHRILLMARDAMLYRQMMAKAQAAAKKVEHLPQRVERPGGGESNPLDGRTKAMKRLESTGSVRDAASLFSLLRNKS